MLSGRKLFSLSARGPDLFWQLQEAKGRASILTAEFVSPASTFKRGGWGWRRLEGFENLMMLS